MRRLIAVALMMILCLTGCKSTDSGAEKAAIQKRTDLLASSGCEISGQVVADYGEKVYEYVLSCSYTYQGTSTVSIVQPDIIQGMSATVEYGKTTLSFDGLGIDTGILAEPYLTPLGALPSIADAWCSAYISSSCYEALGETECLYVSYLSGYDDEELEYRTWFEKDSLKPIKAEIISEGRAVILVTFD